MGVLKIADCGKVIEIVKVNFHTSYCHFSVSVSPHVHKKNRLSKSMERESDSVEPSDAFTSVVTDRLTAMWPTDYCNPRCACALRVNNRNETK